MLRIIALIAMIAGSAQAADETLTLACKGTVQRNAMKSGAGLHGHHRQFHSPNYHRLHASYREASAHNAEL
jgi:hypothetical protein